MKNMDQTLINKMTSWMPWAKSGKRPSSEDEESDSEEPNLLLSLLYPDVTDVVLDFLDVKSLLALRLVCKRTKWWVESQPKYLSKLRITLHSSAGSKKMRKVLRTKVDFCNFQIGCEKRNNEELILEFGLRFGPTLKILDINTITSHTITVNLLSHCQSLEALALLGIDLAKMGPTEIEDLKKIEDLLGNLKALSIGNVLFVEEKEMDYFKALLNYCHNLNSLRLPYVNFQSKRPKEVRDKILEKYVLSPVIQGITRRRAQGHPKMKYLILEHLNPLPSQLFERISEACYQSNTILHNVHESHLKRLMGPGPSAQKTGEKVQAIIGTLDGLNSNILLGKLMNLKCISIWVSSALSLTEKNYENPTLPKLMNINLFVDTVEEDPKINRLISTILGTPRESVSSLKISYNSRKGAISAELVKAIDISHNFQYLKKLDIYQWDAFDEEFLTLWQGLGSHRIQEMSLLLCTNLSDRGIVGMDVKSPAILALTGLKELHISSLYGSITDVTINRALRNMPLQHLRLYSQSITYDGIANLLDGIFYTTIEYIHFSKPLDCTQKEFFFLVKDIVDAKKCPEFPKRRNLRRRSQPLVFFVPSDEDDDD